MKNAIMTMFLFCCLGTGLWAQTETPTPELEEAPVFEEQIMEEAPAPPPPPPPPPVRAKSPERPAPPAPPSPQAAEIFKVVEDMPHFPGCESETDRAKRHSCAKQALLKYISKHPMYKKEVEMGRRGTAVVGFVVQKDGSLRDVRLLRALTDSAENNANILSIFQDMPNWNPGKQRGVAVDVEMRVPVQF